jgi:benzil reductase ((S)-benzoin forming)
MNYIFITGTSSGIGKALAEIYLKKENTKVFGYSRSQSIEHDNYSHFKTDLSDPNTVAGFSFPDLPDAEKIVLVNNAGLISEILRLGKLDNKKILNDVTVNLAAPIVLINAFVKKYQKMTIPRIIVNVSSGAARRAIDAWGTYCAAKSGIDMIAKVLDEEQKFQKPEHRIKIFSTAPGVVDTQMQDQIRSTDESDFSGLQRFIDLKENNELYSPEKSAALLSKQIESAEQFSEVLYDVRNL